MSSEPREWGVLLATLRPFVARRVPNAADSEDVLQEIYLRMRSGLAAVRDDERLRAWMYAVARSAMIDHYRRNRRHVVGRIESDGEEVANLIDTMGEQGDDSLFEALAGVVEWFVMALPEPYRSALLATELHGRSQADAAREAGVALSTMKSRVQRGRNKLREALHDCCSFGLDARGHVTHCAPKPQHSIDAVRGELTLHHIERRVLSRHVERQRGPLPR